jgi:hypothetical protein
VAEQHGASTLREVQAQPVEQWRLVQGGAGTSTEDSCHGQGIAKGEVMAFWIKANGTVQEVKPPVGAAFTLGELQGMVGGYIEIVRTHTGDFMVLNEEGKLQGLPINEVATERYQYGTHDPVVGDVVIAQWAELEEEQNDEQ